MKTKPSCARCALRRNGIYARRICQPCYEWLRRRGRLEEYPKVIKSSKDHAEDYAWIKANDGLSARDAAARMGINVETLYRVLKKEGVPL